MTVEPLEDPMTVEPLEVADDATSKSVLGKAFLLLDCFRSGEPALSLAELAQRSKLPKSTVHRLAMSLVERGALERSYGNYSLGLRIFELGGLVPRWRAMRESALPFMQDLFEATHEMVHLGLLDGTYVLYLEKIWGHQAGSAVSRIGGRLPAHCTGIGKALLAFSPPEVVEAALARELERRTPYTISDPAVLRQELIKIAGTGIAYDREEATLRLACVASPILDYRGRAVAALSISVPTNRFDPERLAPAVRTAAFGLTRVLPPSAYV